jgi:hypothetical protein
VTVAYLPSTGAGDLREKGVRVAAAALAGAAGLIGLGRWSRGAANDEAADR